MAGRARARSSTGAGRPLALAFLAVLIFVAGGVTTYWWMEGQIGPAVAPTPPPDVVAPAPEATPTLAPTPGLAGPTPAATPIAEPSPMVGVLGAAPPPPPPRAAPPPKARPRPPGARAAAPAPLAKVGDLLSQAETATSQKRYDAAAVLYNQALKIDPANPQARSGRFRVQSLAAGRRFVLGTTAVESLRGVGRDLEGFQKEGVGVKRAPAVEGDLDLTMEPGELIPGRPYAVRVYLHNRGKRGIEIDHMQVSTVVDGKRSTRPLPPKVKEVGSQQRVLLEELPGLWKDEVKSWELEVVVTSKDQDVYRNRLSWQ